MRVPTVLHSQYLVLSGHYFFNGDDQVSSFAIKLLKIYHNFLSSSKAVLYGNKPYYIYCSSASV